MKRRLKPFGFIICLLGLLLMPQHSIAYPRYLKKHLSIREGLPTNTVNCIQKDREGFIWFGTSDGLSRYDGNMFFNFPYSEGVLDIARLTETNNGLLWFTAGQELFAFQRLQQQYFNVGLTENEYSPLLIDDFLFSNDSTLWAVSGGSLHAIDFQYHYDEEGVLQDIPFSIARTIQHVGMTQGQFMALSQSPDGQLVVATDRNELVFFDPASATMPKVITWSSADFWEINQITCLGQEIWIATRDHGAICYTSQTGFVPYAPGRPGQELCYDMVTCVVPFSRSQLLVGTWYGYNILTPTGHPADYTVEAFGMNDLGLDGLVGAHIQTALYNDDGSFFLGTRGDGVIFGDVRQSHIYRYTQAQPNDIYAISHGPQGHIWMVTAHKGLMKSLEPFQPDSLLDFRPIFGPWSDVSKLFQDMAPDSNHDLWICGREGKFGRVVPDQRDIQTFPLVKNDTVQQVTVSTLLPTEQYGILLGTEEGLYQYIPGEAYASPLPITIAYGKSTLSCPITALADGENQFVWVGTDKGLYKVDMDKKTSGKPHTQYNSWNRSKALKVYTLCSASDGKLYVGYDLGMSVLDKATFQVDTFLNIRTSLPDDHIARIVEDQEGHIWVGSDAALSRYDKHNHSFLSLDVASNIHGMCAWDGFLFAGNYKELVYMNPHDLLETYINPRDTYFTALLINGNVVRPRQVVNKQEVLSRSIFDTKSLRLAPKNHDFSLAFSSFTYSENLQQFLYRVIPGDTVWRRIDAWERPSFSHLSNGRHTIEVKSITLDGETGRTAQLAVYMQPEWYQSHYFYFFLILMVLGACYLVFTFTLRSQRTRLRSLNLRKEVQSIRMGREQDWQQSENQLAILAHLSDVIKTINQNLYDTALAVSKAAISPSLQAQIGMVVSQAASIYAAINHIYFLQKLNNGVIPFSFKEMEMISTTKEAIARLQPLPLAHQYKVEIQTDLATMPLTVDYSLVKALFDRIIYGLAIRSTKDITITVNFSYRDIKGVSYGIITVSANEPADPKMAEVGILLIRAVTNVHHGMSDIYCKDGVPYGYTLLFPAGVDQGQYLLAHESPAVLSPSPVPERAKKRLLIIEENFELQNYLTTLLEPLYDLAHAFHSSEGIQLSHSMRPDLIVCSIMAPGYDGLYFCQLLRNNPDLAHTPVIMITSSAKDKDKVLDNYLLRINDYIMFPFNPDDLRLKIANLLTLREQAVYLYAETIIKVSLLPLDNYERLDPFLQRVINLVEINAANPSYNESKAAAELKMTFRTLHRKMSVFTDLPGSDFIKYVKLCRSAVTLMSKNYSLEQVMEIVGYSDENTFTKDYLKLFGKDSKSLIFNNIPPPLRK